MKKISTTKIILFVVFLICIEILVFCEIMMDKYGDMSAMYALISVPVTLVPIVLGYLIKSKAENTQHGITYEIAMLEKQQELQQSMNDAPDDGAVG